MLQCQSFFFGGGGGGEGGLKVYYNCKGYDNGLAIDGHYRDSRLCTCIYKAANLMIH